MELGTLNLTQTLGSQRSVGAEYCPNFQRLYFWLDKDVRVCLGFLFDSSIEIG